MDHKNYELLKTGVRLAGCLAALTSVAYGVPFLNRELFYFPLSHILDRGGVWEMFHGAIISLQQQVHVPGSFDVADIKVVAGSGCNRENANAEVGWMGYEERTTERLSNCDIEEKWANVAWLNVGKRVLLDVYKAKELKKGGWKVWRSSQPHPTTVEVLLGKGFLSPGNKGLFFNTGARGQVQVPIGTHQAKLAFCAVNSICLASGQGLPSFLGVAVDNAIRAHPSRSLRQVAGMINQAKHITKQVGFHLSQQGQAGSPLAWLHKQTTGRFAVELLIGVRMHCVAWDAERQVLFDTDPQFPQPLAVADCAKLGVLDVPMDVWRIDFVQSSIHKKKRKKQKRPTGLPN
jgi:hypothetical protein